MKADNLLYVELNFIKEFIYDKCSLYLTNLKLNLESAEYAAGTFELNGLKIINRIYKITPKKTGQFVAIWKRNENGITEPFDIVDDFDIIIITSKNNERIGQFIFPKLVLAVKGIITQNKKDGKRRVRVYPTWDIVTNIQSEKTQNWQTKYFVEIKSDNTIDLNLIKKLFIQTLKN